MKAIRKMLSGKDKGELPAIVTPKGSPSKSDKSSAPDSKGEVLPTIGGISSSSINSPALSGGGGSDETPGATKVCPVHAESPTVDVTQTRKRLLYRTEGGYCTSNGRIDWCKANGIFDAENAQKISKSLVADVDTNTTLYYWQLFSLLGLEMIRALVTDFYESVYADKEERWFRDAFVQISDAQHHISSQTAYWADAFGGGPYYHGGDYRLNFHHQNNAEDVMNAAGATRWMHHMKHALLVKGHANRFNALDRRIFPCIVDFLDVKMQKYAVEHKWTFDKKPFDELREHIVSTTSNSH